MLSEYFDVRSLGTIFITKNRVAVMTNRDNDNNRRVLSRKDSIYGHGEGGHSRESGPSCSAIITMGDHRGGVLVPVS